MHSNNSNGSRAACAGGFMALFAVLLALGLGLSALPAAAAPFAYVSNSSEPLCVGGGAVSVVDTGAKPPAVVATVVVGFCPAGVAITPGRETRLCGKSDPRPCLGDRHGHQHRDGHGPGGDDFSLKRGLPGLIP